MWPLRIAAFGITTMLACSVSVSVSRPCQLAGRAKAGVGSAGMSQVVIAGQTAAGAIVPLKVSADGSIVAAPAAADPALPGSAQAYAAGNLPPTALVSSTPNPSLMAADGILTLVTPGGAGSAGSATLNVIYTDLGGVQQTRALAGPLDINAASGAEARGSLLFVTNGATPIQYSVTGITTPGVTAIFVAASTRRLA